MKKILCIFLMITMLFSVAAFADEETATPPDMPSGDMTPPGWDGNGQPPEPPEGGMTPP